MHDVELAAVAIRQAATDLRMARRHANWLDRLAWALGALGITLGALLVAGDLAFIGIGSALVLGGVLTWGVLRALALLLHLRVDETMVHLADEAGLVVADR